MSGQAAVLERTAPDNLLKSPPLRLHHRAIVTRDQEANRQFFEDLLGIPLVATWCESNFSPAVNRQLVMCHTFYGLADGSALAFFQFADPEVYDLCKAGEAEVKFFDHTALKIDPAGFDEMVARLQKAEVSHRVTDHGYCKSVYVTSPDGLILEFTTDPEDADEIAAWQKGIAHGELKRWLGGDHTPNNTHRPKAH